MVSDNNQKAFLALLRAGLLGKDIQLSPIETFDLSVVFNYASKQTVIGLVVAGIDCYKNRDPRFPVSKEMMLQLIGETIHLEQINRAMNEFIAELIDRLRSTDIKAILVKGQGLAQCYERPLWRSCGDVDLLLDSKNYEKAKQYLIPLAEAVEAEDTYCKHIGMTINSWIVELHGSLHTELSSRIDKMLDKIQYDTIAEENVRCWVSGNVNVFLPGANNDIIFVFTHLLKHFYKGGIGLRQVCDWCRLMWTYKDTINVNLLENRLRTMRLMTEWKAFSAFAVNYLGMPIEAMPIYDHSEKWKRKAEGILAFVMMSGNMGHNRDVSYYNKKSFLIKKAMSAKIKIGDLVRHAWLFPLDSLRFFPYLMYNGIRSAIKVYKQSLY